MFDDFEVGRVIAVDTAQVTVELHQDLKALTRATYEGSFEVGRINSYVILPVGSSRLVAIVTRIKLGEEAELQADRTMVTLPRARRVMYATLIGTIDGYKFRQGVSVFPVLDNPVLLPSKTDLDSIFQPSDGSSDDSARDEQPGYCIKIGESAVFEGYPIYIDPDAFFGKHAAILGSTGSGKSCTIASIIQSILEREEVKRTHFVILDTNGEYRSAFQEKTEAGEWKNAGRWNVLYIPSDPRDKNRLVIPYWFLNAEDFVRLFRAQQGVQRPVLLEALRLARNSEVEKTRAQALREELIREFNRMLSLADDDGRTSKDIYTLAKGLKARVDDSLFSDAWAELPPEAQKKNIETVLQRIMDRIDEVGGSSYSGCVIDSRTRAVIQAGIGPIYTNLCSLALKGKASAGSAEFSADMPRFFSKLRFRTRYIEQVLRRQESGGARARDNCGSMLLRIDRLFADTRFEFLFGPVDGDLPNPEHVLAAFLRDVLGLPSRLSESYGSEDTSNASHNLPFYKRQLSGGAGHHVVILDLSLLAAEVLENVTALIGRLILEFLQRLGELGGGTTRGSLPVVLVLEEAQNYLPERRKDDEESISRLVFERIAREGRKYGLGLVVASQRPSELSKTVLSQCSSFVVHRLQNPEDLRYFKEIVPAVYGPLLDQLPALARQTALVLGECVRAPALVRIREARPRPRSDDPRFYRYWCTESPEDVPVEKVCAYWEGEEVCDEVGLDSSGTASSENGSKGNDDTNE